MGKMIRFIRGSLQRTLFVLIVLFIILPTGAMGVIAYRQYSQIITEKVSTLSQNNVMQVSSNIEAIFRSIQNNSLSFYQNGQVRDFLLAPKEEREEAGEALDRYIGNYIAYEEYLYGVEFVRMDGYRYGSTSVAKRLTEEQKLALQEKGGKPLFITDAGSGRERLYGYARCIRDINYLDTEIGFEALYIKKDQILRLLKEEETDTGTEYYIVEGNEIIISTNEEALGRDPAEYLGEDFCYQKKGSRVFHYSGSRYMASCARISYPGWQLIQTVPLTQMNEEKWVVAQIILSAVILAVAICSLGAYFLSRSVLRPLNTLETSMKEIEKNHFKTMLPESGYNEIAVLSKAFNRMSVRLDELVNQVYLAQIKEKDAQLQAMQAYINPHFLYNTLDTICWMSRMEDAQETCNLIEALSKLFRMSARDTRKVISVEQELEYINSYIMIQECRHTDFIQFEVQAQEETLKCQTVRFILQPLVENAILHGLEPTGRPGKLSIDIRRQEDKLVMTVEDDGMGADIEELRELLQSHPEGLRGMGISNVNDRIRLCFGEEYGIFFYNAEGGGLRVQAVQPFRQMGEQK